MENEEQKMGVSLNLETCSLVPIGCFFIDHTLSSRLLTRLVLLLSMLACKLLRRRRLSTRALGLLHLVTLSRGWNVLRHLLSEQMSIELGGHRVAQRLLLGQ